MSYEPAVTSQMAVSTAIRVGLFLLVVVLAIADHSRFRINWRVGIVVGFVWFLLRLPEQVLTLGRVQDLVAAVQARVPTADPHVVSATVYLGLVISFTILVLGIPWYMLVYHAAADQWEGLRPTPFPSLQLTGRTPWPAVMGATGFGVAAGVVGVVVFKLIGAGPPDALAQYRALGVSGATAGPAVGLTVAALAVTAVALAGELTYRGVLFGWLLRRMRWGGTGVALAAVLTSLVWAAVQSPNPDAPWVGYALMFVIGLFFCEFARRICLEAAIAAHVGLNLAVLLAGLALR